MKTNQIPVTKQPSERLLEGDLSLTLPELRHAETTIIQALELDPAEQSKVAMRLLLTVTRSLIAQQTN